MESCAVLGSPILTDSRLFPLSYKGEGEGMRKFKDVIAEARMVAMLNPLGRNENAAYTERDGEPCCIFGHVLERLGIGIASWEVLNNFTLAELPWADFGFEEPNAYQILWTTKVQAAADSGDAWIIAIAMADATLI
ncbi:hypothetical protein SEA_LUMOS_42 [Mycobacterium phage Lumos]|uniref:Uncharacterized protein n=2 Tax=Lumosvirus TaxID=2948808 RepID=A0A0K2CMG2_9CAUD|nr:hypothetical protein J4T93_gp042 [Mycobacterium phage Lumos]ALA06558.1 hypothetical protein SEA_LUMOS_42 [Mycobacterium phage Lumos]